MTRVLSLVSLKTDGRSEITKSTTSCYEGDLDFEYFIQSACQTFECPVFITVARKMPKRRCLSRLKSGDISKLRQDSKTNRKRFIQPPAVVVLPIPGLDFRFESDKNLLVTAVYDSSLELVEILMFKSHVLIPRVLMQVIALKVPFTQTLTKFTIRQCCIDVYTIYELNKILTISNITDVCLDHSPVKEGNYDILLSDPSALRSLSLARCDINDIVCERIASRLHRLQPAEQTLLILNLSSNHITDVGLKHLGEALRTNRHLRYLNIADNRIGDDGAKCILEMLTEFPLNFDEIQDKNRCYMQYLRERESRYNKYMLNMVNSHKLNKKGTSGKHKNKMKIKKGVLNESDLDIKARSMALEVLGPFEHPFSPSMVTVKRGQSCCIGNFTLCYLNLRYNNLTYQSVKRLTAIVRHQKIYRNEKLCGLLKVLLEGNYVPENSTEIINLNNGTVSQLNIKEADKIIAARRNTVQLHHV